MPIYEYVCSACGHRFEKLVRSISTGESKVDCPRCQEHEAERAVSTFALGGGSSSALEPATPSAGAG